MSDYEYNVWQAFYRNETARFRFPVYPGTRYDQIATQRAWARYNAWKHPKIVEWTTHNNEAGKDRTRDELPESPGFRCTEGIAA